MPLSSVYQRFGVKGSPGLRVSKHLAAVGALNDENLTFCRESLALWIVFAATPKHGSSRASLKMVANNENVGFFQGGPS